MPARRAEQHGLVSSFDETRPCGGRRRHAGHGRRPGESATSTAANGAARRARRAICRTAAATAASTPAARAPQWSGGYPTPGKPPPGLRPPSSAPPPHLRRPVELIPELNLAFPHCAGGDVSDDRCTGVRGGLGFGFAAIWRVTPHLAWGGGFDLAGFRYDAPQRLGLRQTGAAAAQLRLIGRLYFLGEGSFDPYVEIGIGGAALGTSAPRSQRRAFRGDRRRSGAVARRRARLLPEPPAAARSTADGDSGFRRQDPALPGR